MIVRDQNDTLKILLSWRGTILPKVLPPLGFVMLISAIVGLKLTEAAHIMLRICGMLLLVVFVSDKALHVSEKY